MTADESAECCIHSESSNQSLACHCEDEDHHEDEHGHDADIVLDSIVASASILGALFIVTGNLGTLIAFGRCRRLQTIPNMYFCSLAVADLLVGLMLFLQGALGFPVTDVAVAENKYFCLCVVSFLFISVAASIFSSTLEAGDRYLFIRYPLRYESLITQKRSLISIIVTWCLAMAYGCVPLYWNHFDPTEECAPTHIFPRVYMIILHPAMFFGLSALTFTLHVQICRIALKHQSRIQAQQFSVQVRTKGTGKSDERKPESADLAKVNQQQEREQEQNKSQPANGQASQAQDIRPLSRANWKMMKAMILTFGLFFLCWLPLLIVAYLEYTIHVSHTVLALAGLIGVLNSGKNPLVLAAMNRDFRREFQVLFCCSGCCWFHTGRVSPDTK